MVVKTFCMHPEWDQEEIYGDIAILILHRLVFVSPIFHLLAFWPIRKIKNFCKQFEIQWLGQSNLLASEKEWSTIDKQLFHRVDDDWLRPSANQKAAYFDLKSDYRRNDEYCMISGFGRTQGKSYFTQL